jgi:hypothetical protein
MLKKELHSEVVTSKTGIVHATDGTYNIIHVINRNMSNTSLKEIYPPKDATTPSKFNNALSGDKDHGGKFLIELRDYDVSSSIGLSHYVSFDTDMLEIYDPMSTSGAIVTQRNSDGHILFLETLNLCQKVKVFKIWKLLQKPKRSNLSDDVEQPKRKKRRGKKRHTSMFYME